jgi:hypothetical protein
MRLNIITLACAALLAIGLSFGVGAGPIVDTDSDGVIDDLDNCTTVPNPDQCDLDLDGYGSACDGDYTQDWSTGGPDFSTFKSWFGSIPAAPPEIGADQNCDGVVGGPDFATFKGLFGTVVGPSGLLCAGSVACGGV